MHHDHPDHLRFHRSRRDSDFVGCLTVAYSASTRLMYPLTSCCQASATGTMGGVACRKCYEEVDPIYGDCIRLESTDAHRDLSLWFRWMGYKADESDAVATDILRRVRASRSR